MHTDSNEAEVPSDRKDDEQKETSDVLDIQKPHETPSTPAAECSNAVSKSSPLPTRKSSDSKGCRKGAQSSGDSVGGRNSMSGKDDTSRRSSVADDRRFQIKEKALLLEIEKKRKILAKLDEQNRRLNMAQRRHEFIDTLVKAAKQKDREKKSDTSTYFKKVAPEVRRNRTLLLRVLTKLEGMDLQMITTKDLVSAGAGKLKEPFATRLVPLIVEVATKGDSALYSDGDECPSPKSARSATFSRSQSDMMSRSKLSRPGSGGGKHKSKVRSHRVARSGSNLLRLENPLKNQNPQYRSRAHTYSPRRSKSAKRYSSQGKNKTGSSYKLIAPWGRGNDQHIASKKYVPAPMQRERARGRGLISDGNSESKERVNRFSKKIVSSSPHKGSSAPWEKGAKSRLNKRVVREPSRTEKKVGRKAFPEQETKRGTELVSKSCKKMSPTPTPSKEMPIIRRKVLEGTSHMARGAVPQVQNMTRRG